MAVTHQDPLSMHGTGSTSRTNMLNSSGIYTNLGANGSCESDNPRIPGGYAWKVPSGQNAQLGVALGGQKTTFGAGIAHWITSLPSQATAIAAFKDQGGTTQFLLVCNVDGSLKYVLGNNPNGVNVIGTSGPGALYVGAYVHLEAKHAMGNTTSGSSWLRVNKKAAITATGIDNVTSLFVECTTVEWFPTATSEFGLRYGADPFAWDTSGSYNTDWIGNKVSVPIALVADTASADWTPNGAASAYQCLDETAPNGATDFIEAAAVNDETECDLADPPSWVSNIACVSIMSVQTLDSAGSSQTELSLRSAAAYAQGADRALSYPAWTMYADHIQRDPNGDIAFDRANMLSGAFKIRAKRTA